MFKFRHNRSASYGTVAGMDSLTVRIKGFAKETILSRLREVGLGNVSEVLSETRSQYLQFSGYEFKTNDPDIANFLRSQDDIEEVLPDEVVPSKKIVSIGSMAVADEFSREGVD